MKNENCLRWTIIHFAIFLTFVLLSSLSLLLYRFTLSELGFGFGRILMYGWMLNPLPICFAVIGLGRYLLTRKEKGVRSAVGRRWLIYPVVMIGSVFLWCVFAGIHVACTGGV